MRGRLLDLGSVLVLLVALALLAWPRSPTPSVVQLPLLLPDDAPGSLHLPGADRQAIQARAAALGEVITIEDLVRVVVALEEDSPEAAGLAPLDPSERQELRALVDQARQHRTELMAVEAELAAARDRLDGAARDMAGELSPEQRRWVQEHRDETSVQGVEEAYWKRAAEGLE